MNFFDVLNVSASGLGAQRVRMETVASNLANAQTTRTADGGPYRRRDVVFRSTEPASFKSQFDAALRGVEVAEIVLDKSEFQLRYEPGNPDADGNGYVKYPNVEPMNEMVNLVSSTRSYEANLTVIEATKSMMLQTMEI